jgi:hypothetical protein
MQCPSLAVFGHHCFAKCPLRATRGHSEFPGKPDCLIVENNTLAIERRGGPGGGATAMRVRSVGRDQRPWDKGLLIGQEKPLEPEHIWSIRIRPEITRSWRDLVIFNLAIDSKLRACDLVKLRLDDICSGARVRHRVNFYQIGDCNVSCNCLPQAPDQQRNVLQMKGEVRRARCVGLTV